MLESMGFTRSQCIMALKNTDNNVDRAADWIFSHLDEINNEENLSTLGATPGQASTEPTEPIDGSSGTSPFPAWK